MKKLPFYFTDEIHLKKYTTTEDDFANKIRRDPKFDMVQMDIKTLCINCEEKQKSKAKRRRMSKMSFLDDDVLKEMLSQYEQDKKEIKISFDDFDIIKVLGRGTYGKVMLVEKKDNKKCYAMKTLRKKYIVDEN